MPVVNEDITIENKFDITFGQKFDNYNVVVKNGLQEGRDFIFLNQKCW